MPEVGRQTWAGGCRYPRVYFRGNRVTAVLSASILSALVLISAAMSSSMVLSASVRHPSINSGNRGPVRGGVWDFSAWSATFRPFVPSKRRRVSRLLSIQSWQPVQRLHQFGLSRGSGRNGSEGERSFGSKAAISRNTISLSYSRLDVRASRGRHSWRRLFETVASREEAVADGAEGDKVEEVEALRGGHVGSVVGIVLAPRFQAVGSPFGRGSGVG